jgi:5'-methylthioadenosine phosphorylase
VPQGRIGVIGGSGLYDMEGFADRREVTVPTPFGAPSDLFVTGTLEGRDVAFLSRHGRGHRISPSEINYRANVWGMKKLGVDFLISVSACGSLKEEIHPGDFAIVDQHRPDEVAHGDVLRGRRRGARDVRGPGDAVTREASRRRGGEVGRECIAAGTYICMEGRPSPPRGKSPPTAAGARTSSA